MFRAARALSRELLSRARGASRTCAAIWHAVPEKKSEIGDAPHVTRICPDCRGACISLRSPSASRCMPLTCATHPAARTHRVGSTSTTQAQEGLGKGSTSLPTCAWQTLVYPKPAEAGRVGEVRQQAVISTHSRQSIVAEHFASISVWRKASRRPLPADRPVACVLLGCWGPGRGRAGVCGLPVCRGCVRCGVSRVGAARGREVSEGHRPGDDLPQLAPALGTQPPPGPMQNVSKTTAPQHPRPGPALQRYQIPTCLP